MAKKKTKRYIIHYEFYHRAMTGTFEVEAHNKIEAINALLRSKAKYVDSAIQIQSIKEVAI